MKSNKRLILFFIIILILAIYITNSITRLNIARTGIVVNSHKWDKLLLILEQVEKNYVDTIDYQKFVEDILPDVLGKLDPHSIYLSPEQLKESDEPLVGNFSGIGIQFNVPNDTAVVISVISGGPSEKVGLLSGDRIVKVDGK
jgi:Periplasmic protease